MKYQKKLIFWYSVCGALDAMKYEYSASFLRYALQPNPIDLRIEEGDPLIEKIKNDTNFKNALAKIISTGAFNDPNASVIFHDDFDLFGSLHNMQMIVIPKTIDGVDKYHVHLSDRYDFDIEKDYSSEYENPFMEVMYAGAIAGNNLAVVEQYIGPINNYYIDIEFYVDK